MQLDINLFLYAESDANYLNVVFYDAGVHSTTLRMTLKQFEEATAAYPQVARCHRAYILNINQVSYLESSGGKGTAHFDVYRGTVPVSKTYMTEISSRLKSVDNGSNLHLSISRKNHLSAPVSGATKTT